MSKEPNHNRRRFLAAAAMAAAAVPFGVTGCAERRMTSADIQLPVEGEFPYLGGATPDKSHTYAAPAQLSLNQWALSGEWTVGRGAVALSKAGGRIAYGFHARDLHLVMGPSARGTSVRFRVALDGRPAAASHGVDVDDRGDGTVTEQRLYQLIRQPKPIADRRFEIEFLDPGVEAFAFTFG